MKLLDPFPIGDAQLVSSNVVETDPEFDIGESYAAGDVVRDEATHTRFESQTNGNTGHALSDAAYWVELGPTNRWAMFDAKVGTVTVAGDETIDVTLTSTGLLTGVALFGLEAATVQVIVNDTVEGEVFNETYSTASHENVNNIWDYFFASLLRRANLSVENLPPYYGAEVRVIITQPDGNPACGNLVIGYWNDLGGTEWGTEYGTIDFSKPKEDQFNHVELKKGLNRPTITGSSEVDTVLVDEAKRVIDDALGEARVWKVNERSSGLILGFARQSRISDRNPAFAILSADLEAIG